MDTFSDVHIGDSHTVKEQVKGGGPGEGGVERPPVQGGELSPEHH